MLRSHILVLGAGWISCLWLTSPRTFLPTCSLDFLQKHSPWEKMGEIKSLSCTGELEDFLNRKMLSLSLGETHWAPGLSPSPWSCGCLITGSVEGWAGLWATWYSQRGPCPRRGLDNFEIILRCPLKPKPLYDSNTPIYVSRVPETTLPISTLAFLIANSLPCSSMSINLHQSLEMLPSEVAAGVFSCAGREESTQHFQESGYMKKYKASEYKW